MFVVVKIILECMISQKSRSVSFESANNLAITALKFISVDQLQLMPFCSYQPERDNSREQRQPS